MLFILYLLGALGIGLAEPARETASCMAQGPLSNTPLHTSPSTHRSQIPRRNKAGKPLATVTVTVTVMVTMRWLNLDIMLSQAKASHRAGAVHVCLPGILTLLKF